MSASRYADRVAVVVNGNARAVTDSLVTVLEQIIRSGDLFVSRTLEEGEEIAKTVAERGYGTVLTGGGDGTFTHVVTAVMKHCKEAGFPAPRFGFLKLGTGNALAWAVGAGRIRSGDLFADIARLTRDAGSRPLRMLEVEGKLCPFAGLGIDANTLHDYEDTKRLLSRHAITRPLSSGAMAYLITVIGRSLPAYLFRPHDRVRIINQGDDAVRLGIDGQPIGAPIKKGEVLIEGRCRMVAMSTIPYWGFGARIFPFAEERPDRFNLRVVDMTSADVVINIRQIWDGTYRSPTLHDFLAQDVSIEYERPMALQIAGDAAGKHRQVRARLYPEPVNVVDHYAPPRA